MHMDKLCLHAGGRGATFDEVRAVPVPARTPTWNPLPYEESLSLIRETIPSVTRREVVAEEFGLNRGGAQMFALMRLGAEPGDPTGLGPVVGVRGSYDQSLSNGLVCGARVFVCDNLAFSGDAFKIMRKNTTYVHRDWREMVVEHLGGLLGHYQAVAERADAMRGLPCALRRGFALLGVALGERVINSEQANRSIAEWRRPAHEEFAERNLWSFYNCLTEGAKKGAAGDTIDRHVRVDHFIEAVAIPRCSAAAPAAS